MNRWIVPGVALAVVAAAVAGGPFLPVAMPPVDSVPVDAARVSTLCPLADSTAVTQSFAAVSSSQPVRLAVLGQPDGADQKDLLTVVPDPAAWTRVSALASDRFGAATWNSAPDGAERGMSGTPCLEPSTEQWFTGVELTPDTQASLLLANIDAMDAMADITIWTTDGPGKAAGLGGVKVGAGQTTEVPLNVKLVATDPVAVRVSASKGRLVAYLRQRLWRGTQPRGADWIPPGTRPATTVIVPGVPAGAGSRKLVIANPGTAPVVVGAEFLGAGGVSALAGLDAIEVSPQSVVTVPADAVIAEQEGALRLKATGAITAGMIASSGGKAEVTDPAFLAAVPRLGTDGLWPFPIPSGMNVSLQLTNTGTVQEAATVITATAPGKNENSQEVPIPAGSTVILKLPKSDMRLVRIQTVGTDLYGALVASGKVGKLAGLAVVPLLSAEPTGDVARVGYDPRVGA